MKMKVLIGCEESQAICKAFRELGYEAYSNDLIECSGGHPEWHLQMDVFDAIDYQKWDLIILHPPCTALAVSGNGTYGVDKPKHNERLEAVEWTQKLWDKACSVCEHVALENPVGVLNSMGNFPKPQYIQPWMFGYGETKKTGFWLYGLPDLYPTNKVEGREQKIWKMGPSEDRAKLRSKTYLGIAKAKYEKEVEKVKEVNDASKKYEVEEFAAKTAVQTAKKIKAEGEAQAAANRALVSAGLTPQQQMELQIKIAEVTSGNIAKVSTPQVVVVNGGGANGGNTSDALMNILGAERGLELLKKFEKGTK